MSDFVDLDFDNLEGWLADMEEQATDSPLVYSLPDKAGQRSLQALCQGYVRASKKQRAVIRSAVSDKRGIQNQLIAYVHKSAEHLRATRDVEWLRIGAAAVALQGGGLDYRDFLLALAELYVTAEEVGLNPEVEFAAVSIGLPDKFHTYAVVKSRRGRKE